jgi:hypothetical protein
MTPEHAFGRRSPGRTGGCKDPLIGANLRIENIEEMRRRQGIDDVELRAAIGGLSVGDSVRLTLLSGDDASAAGETVVVRITAINGPRFRGTLAARPVLKALNGLKAGLPLAFTADCIHSVVQERSTHGE